MIKPPGEWKQRWLAVSVNYLTLANFVRSIQTRKEKKKKRGNNFFAQYGGKGEHEDKYFYQQADSMDMDPGRPEKHDVCRDPELKANPDIAGICVSYVFLQTLLNLIF